MCLADITIKANIIHWSLIEYKKVICSILAAKLYKMTYGFDIGAIIKVTLGKILKLALPLIFYTDLKSL